jgi:hypothetical protein
MRERISECVLAFFFWRPEWWLNWTFQLETLKLRYRYGDLTGERPVTLRDILRIPMAVPNVLEATQQPGYRPESASSAAQPPTQAWR